MKYKESRTNQIGYMIQQAKIIVVVGMYKNFQIRNIETKEVLFEGDIVGEKYDESSGDIVRYAVFTDFQTPGMYMFCLDGCEEGEKIIIGDGIYESVADQLLQVIYLQRCGCQISKEKYGIWGRVACHVKDAVLIGQGRMRERNVVGGWHDAGDYGRYTVPTIATIKHILFTYELLETNLVSRWKGIDAFKNRLLEDARYGMRWIEKMQDESGGFYQKVTSAKYPGLDVLPEKDESTLYICPVTTQATATAVAIAARVSFVFEKIDLEFSKQCWGMALKGWKFLEQNQESIYYKNPDMIETESYITENDIDCRFWAVCELYNATGEEKYSQLIAEMLEKEKFDLCRFDWRLVGGWGTLAYLMTSQKKIPEIENELEKAILNQANALVEISKNNGYMISMVREDYVWGSFMNLLNNGICLMTAGLLKGREEYHKWAQEHIHYIFGKNPLSICYVTGMGENRIFHPHHRVCIAYPESEPIKGMVIGGPNVINQDSVSAEKLKGCKPGKAYIDDVDCFSVNEMTTYWNTATLILVVYYGNKRREG